MTLIKLTEGLHSPCLSEGQLCSVWWGGHVHLQPHTHAGQPSPGRICGFLYEGLSPKLSSNGNRGIPEAAFMLVLRDRAREQGGSLALHVEHGFWPHGLLDSTVYPMAADSKGKTPVLGMLGHHAGTQSPQQGTF